MGINRNLRPLRSLLSHFLIMKYTMKCFIIERSKFIDFNELIIFIRTQKLSIDIITFLYITLLRF